MYTATSSQVHPIGYATCIVPPLSLPSSSGNLSSDHTDRSSSAFCSVSPLPRDDDYDSRQRYYDKRESEPSYFPCSFSTSSRAPPAENERKVVSPSSESMDEDIDNPSPVSCNKQCYGFSRSLVSQSETASIPKDEEEHYERQMDGRDKTVEELPVTLPGPCVASSQLKFGIDRLLAKDVKPNRTPKGDNRFVVYCK